MRHLTILFLLLLTGCFWMLDENFYVQKITKDFNINIVNHARTATINLNEDDEFGGEKIIKETVRAIWHNDDLIIAQRSPNLLPEIKKGLYADTIYGPYYLIKDKRYLDFLPEGTEVKKIDGKLYHNSLTWSRPDSLYPYNKISKYYIIDHSQYNNGWLAKLLNRDSKTYKVYILNSKSDLEQKLKQYGINESVELKKIKTTR